MRTSFRSTACVLAGLCLLPAPAFAADPDTVFSYDFEDSAEPGRYPCLSFPKEVEAAIVAPGADGKGHALRIRTAKPSRYAQVTLNQPFPLQKNLVLSFDHREEIEPGKTASFQVIPPRTLRQAT